MYRNGACATERRRSKNGRIKKLFLSLVAVSALIGSSSICAIQLPSASAGDEPILESPPQTQPVEPTPPLETDAPLDTAPPTPPTDEAEITVNDDEEPKPEAGYDYSKPVPESVMVDDSYFDDAVFIGDSRTEGLMMYTNLSNATFYTDKGLTVDTVFSKQIVYINGEWLSVMDALRYTQFSKVYIMFGINEAGWAYSDIFTQDYGLMIDTIKEIKPEATIYIQQIMPVTEHTSQTHRYIKMKKINEYNALLSQLAEEKQVYFVDTGGAVANGNGYLPSDAAVDGIHLKKPYCGKWLDYLKTHTVSDKEG